MLKFISKYIALFFIPVFISCASSSSRIQIWQPWTRTFQKDTIQVQPKSKIALVISGETKSLIGDESILQEEMGTELKSLLERRGYIISSVRRQILYREK